MKQNINLKSFLLAAAASLGLAATAAAQSANVAVPAPDQTTAVSGLLGSRYVGVEGNYYDLTAGDPGVARGLTAYYNQPLNAYLDLNADYSWAEAQIFGYHVDQQQLDLGATAFTKLSWGKPFVLADLGWQWANSRFASDDSFAYKIGAGVEFQVLRELTVIPFATFVRSTGFNQSEIDGGVKAAYRFTRDWSVTARVQYDWICRDKDTVEYAAGLNFNF